MLTRAETVEFVHTDPLGSPAAISNQAGQVIERLQYEPYGANIGQSNGDRPGYTGHVMDGSTGLTYMQQRYYDPIIGKFFSTDPVQADGNTGASFNRYWYAANNPYKFKDPDGRDVVFSVDPNGAGGNGHTTLYFQDAKGHWYSYNQGAVGDGGSSGNVTFLSGRDQPAGVAIERVDAKAIPQTGLRIHTSRKQDALISNSAAKSMEAHNVGKVQYNLYSNNCTDAAVDVVNNSGAGITVSNSATTVKPNSWIKEIRNDRGAVKRDPPPPPPKKDREPK